MHKAVSNQQHRADLNIERLDGHVLGCRMHEEGKEDLSKLTAANRVAKHDLRTVTRDPA